MAYEITNAIEYLLHEAGAHKWPAMGALAALLAVVMYQVMKHQYDGQAGLKK